MFQNLNPLDRPTAILEIVIMLLGAAVIGFLIAWTVRKPKVAAAPTAKENPADKKAEARISQLEKAAETQKAEKSKLEEELNRALQSAKDKEAALRQELELAKSKATEANKNAPNSAFDNAKKQIADLEKALENRKSRLLELETASTKSQAAIDALQKEIADLKANALKPSAETEALQKEIADLKANALKPSAETEALQKEIAALKANVLKPSAETEALQKEIADLKANALQVSSVEAAALKSLREENAALKAAGGDATEITRLQEALAAASPSADLSKELETLRKTLAEAEAKLAAAPAGAAEPTERLRELERQLRDAQRSNFNLQADLTKARNEKPAAGDATKELDWLKREKEDLEQDVRDLESRIDRLEKDNSDLRAQTRDKSSAGPIIDKLTKERDRLKAELEKAKKTPADQPLPIVDFSHLGIATADQKDALTRINGIGPVVEGKLNQLGIYTFAQISRLSDSDMDRIDEVLQLFPGRVKRENWVSQAAGLLPS